MQVRRALFTLSLMLPERSKHFHLTIKQKGIKVSFSFWTLGIPWWYIVAINHLPVTERGRFADKLRSRGYFDCLCWVVKCSNWESRPAGICYGPMYSTNILSVCQNLCDTTKDAQWEYICRIPLVPIFQQSSLKTGHTLKAREHDRS